jgi:hypothetical protein
MSAFEEIIAHDPAPTYNVPPRTTALAADRHQQLATVLREYRALAAASPANRRQDENERLPFLSRAVQTLIRAGPLEFEGEDAVALLDILQAVRVYLVLSEWSLTAK